MNTCSMFSSGVFCQVISSSIIMVIFEKLVWPQNLKQWLLVIGHSFSYAFNMPCYMIGSKYISGNTMNVVQLLPFSLYLNTPYSTWKQKLDRSCWSCSGSTWICSGIGLRIIQIRIRVMGNMRLYEKLRTVKEMFSYSLTWICDGNID